MLHTNLLHPALKRQNLSRTSAALPSCHLLEVVENDTQILGEHERE
jgi:hypothetical protein